MTKGKTLEGLLELIRDRKALVGIIGLGYVGLPLVRTITGKGFRVLGFDVDQKKVRLLNGGKSYIDSVPSRVIRSVRKRKRFEATDDFRRLSEPDAILIAVPTPLTAEGRPDLTYIKETAKHIGKHMRKGQLVVLESTTYPGTTREVLLPALQRRSRRCGRDFFLAYSPEREDPGNKKYPMEKIPKVVGGADEASLAAASELYRKFVPRISTVSSTDAAEAAKLLENIYRCINIALVNELKMCFERMDIDVWEVIRAAASKPFGFHPFYPGPGLGGHCIPIDPFYLSWKAKEYQFATRFIDLAGEINVQMPYYVVGCLGDALRATGKRLPGAKVLVLGIAYKRDVDDARESPAFKILDILKERGAKISYHDPYFPKFPSTRRYRHLRIPPVKLTPRTLAAQDAVLIVTDHGRVDYAKVVRHAKLVVDTRNATKDVKKGREKIVQA
ncbi:MAG: nucleotide sugar dehydrogenase [Planctomycetota bacterium]